MSITIRALSYQTEKKQTVREILEALPEWFEVAESREKYIAESAEQLVFAAYDGEKAVGFLCLKETGGATMELAVLGVRKEYHRQGIGRRLLRAAHALAGGERDIAVYLIANEKAVPFYERIGMRKAEDVMQYNHIEWTAFDAGSLPPQVPGSLIPED